MLSPHFSSHLRLPQIAASVQVREDPKEPPAVRNGYPCLRGSLNRAVWSRSANPQAGSPAKQHRRQSANCAHGVYYRARWDPCALLNCLTPAKRQAPAGTCTFSSQFIPQPGDQHSPWLQAAAPRAPFAALSSPRLINKEGSISLALRMLEAGAELCRRRAERSAPSPGPNSSAVLSASVSIPGR